MIDLHSHVLPGIDDGAPDLATAIAMARMAAEDGTRVLACTPHVKRGTWDNEASDIARRVRELQGEIDRAGVRLHLVAGGDIHVSPDLHRTLGQAVPTLGGTRYFLYEPPFQIPPPNLLDHTLRIIEAGFVPVITHPERLAWVAERYETFDALNRAGCLVQITAGAVTGRFGRTVEALAMRMFEEGRVDIVASDAHDTARRPPLLREAVERLEPVIGREEALRTVRDRPAAILRDEAMEPLGASLPPLERRSAGRASGLRRLFGLGRG